jgi:2-phosphoglycerate kinase
MNIVDLDLDSIFQECFTSSHGAVTECECGREHVCIENQDYFDPIIDIEMIEDYWNRAANEDDMIVIHTEYDTIGSIKVGGHYFAEDCECQGWKKYMEFIVNNRREIKDFLVAMADKAQIALEHEKSFNILKDKHLKVLDQH